MQFMLSAQNRRIMPAYSDYYQCIFRITIDFYVEHFAITAITLPHHFPGPQTRTKKLKRGSGAKKGKQNNQKECYVYLKEHQGGKFYDCNDNGRARAAGISRMYW